MLTGPQMLLKSFGINPDEILKNVKDFGDVMLKMQQDIADIKKHLNIPAIPPDNKE